MYLQGLIGLFLKLSIISRMMNMLTRTLLGLAVLGWVVEHCGSRNNEVVVHVMEPDVEVTVGDQTYQIEGRRYDPIVCDLSSGWHRLIMRRGDRILFEESFEVRPGQGAVRTAWDPKRSPEAGTAEAREWRPRHVGRRSDKDNTGEEVGEIRYPGIWLGAQFLLISGKRPVRPGCQVNAARAHFVPQRSVCAPESR